MLYISILIILLLLLCTLSIKPPFTATLHPKLPERNTEASCFQDGALKRTRMITAVFQAAVPALPLAARRYDGAFTNAQRSGIQHFSRQPFFGLFTVGVLLALGFQFVCSIMPCGSGRRCCLP